MSERIPRVGDIVIYRLGHADGRHPNGVQVHPAMVTFVHDDTTVNLVVFADSVSGMFGGPLPRSVVRFHREHPGSWFWRPGEEFWPPPQPAKVPS